MNPYQLLGIDPQIKNPNHFQLLGIKDLVADENQFVGLVQKSVKAKLSLLDQPELAVHPEIVGKLKQRILIAGRVLADSAKRNEYIEQLKAAVQGTTKSYPPAAPPGSEAGRSKASSVTTSRASSSSTSRNLPPASEPLAADTSSKEEIPYAIPMRKPGKTSVTATPAPSPTNPVSKIQFEESEEAEPGQDFSPFGGTNLKTKAPVRRKTSFLSLIAGSLIAITAMGGLVFVAIILSQPRTSTIADAGNPPIVQALQANVDSNQTEPAPVADDVKPVPNSDSGPASESEVKPVSKPETSGELEASPQVNLDSNSDAEEMAETDQAPNAPSEADARVPAETGPTTDMAEPETTPETNKNTTENSSDREPPESNQVDEPKTTTKPEQNDTRARNQSANVWELESEKDTLILAEADQYLIDKHLRIILNRQRLRHPNVVEYTDDLFEYMEKLYFDKNPDKATPYPRILFAFKEVNQYLVGFWSQFEESAATIPGGQEIIVFDRPMSFVEYSDNQLVMRGQGFNIRYRRENIPAELAIKIAEQGAIPDIPSWRLYLTAFLATQQDGHIRNKERITEMLELSLEDGQDVSSMQDFMSFRADPRPLKLKAEMPDMSSIAAVTRKVQDKSSEILGVQMDELQLNEFFDYWMKWEFLWFSHVVDVEDEPEFQDEKPLIHTSLALLHNAISAAVMAKDAARLEEAIVERGYLTGQNTDKIFLEHLTKIAIQKLDLPQAIELKRVSEPLIARVEEDRKLRPIANRVLKRIQTFERQHKINGTGQTFGELR